MIACFVNCIAIIVGALVGCLIGNKIPEKIINTIMSGVALCVIYIGISGSLSGENTLILIISMVIGTAIGTALDLDGRLNRFADKIGEKLTKPGKENKFSEGFVSATLLFCVGAMAIMGSIQAGLLHDYTTIYTKSLIDGISAIAFASTMGIGVAASAVCILIYQGGITLAAGFVSAFITDAMIAEITCCGSLLIAAIGFNMLKVTDIKVMNLLPSVFIPIILCQFM